MPALRSGLAVLFIALLLVLAAWQEASASDRPDHLARAKVFLAAGDFRRAVDSCLAQVHDVPSAER